MVNECFSRINTYLNFIFRIFPWSFHYLTVPQLSIAFSSFSEPEFYFDKTSYDVDESDDNLEVVVYRSGRDLSFKSYVIFATKQVEPVSAKGMLSKHYKLYSFPHDIQSRT